MENAGPIFPEWAPSQVTEMELSICLKKKMKTYSGMGAGRDRVKFQLIC